MTDMPCTSQEPRCIYAYLYLLSLRHPWIRISPRIVPAGTGGKADAIVVDGGIDGTPGRTSWAQA